MAAGAAWTLASTIHSQPFFAPVSAVISLGVARGRRTVRAIELTVGVAIGIAVADLLVHALGGGTLVLMLVVALSMLAALLLGAGTILVNQAAISAILVVATLKPGQGPSPSRLFDALIGGAIALLGDAVMALGHQLEDAEAAAATRRLALEAAVKATSVLDQDPGLSMNVIIGQIRSTAIDLLRGSGLSGEEARNALDAAVQRAGAAP